MSARVASSLRDVPTALSRLRRHLIDFIYPPLCQVCRQGFISVDNNIWLCESCLNKLQIIPAPYCPICRNSLVGPHTKCKQCRRNGYLLWQYSLGIYDDTLSHLIKACKYSDKPGIAKMLGGMIAGQLRQFEQTAQVEIVCPVPMHHRKQSRRGFNQTVLLAEAIAGELSLQFEPELLLQERRNEDQIGLTILQRYRNVHDLFRVMEPGLVKGRGVLVVDDVTTSGATLNAVAHALSDSGAAFVAAATAAMALEENLSPDQLYSMMWEEF